MHHIDYHKTVLHLFGLAADELKHRHNGRDLTLTDGQQGQGVTDLLA